MPEIVPIEIIENKIFVIRGHKVMIDKDLAELYSVKTFRLNEAVKRNLKRFPDEFMFQINDNEKNELIANCDRFKTLKHSTSNPYAFTEYGVVMLSSVLNSDQAISVNIQVVRAFVKLRELALANKDLTTQLNELEQRFIIYAKDTNIVLNEHDNKIDQILRCLKQLTEPEKPKHIGFTTDNT